MSDLHNMSQFSVKVDGAALSPDKAAQVMEIEVDMAMGVADMITLTMYDQEHVYLNGDYFKLGAQLEVAIAGRGEPVSLAKAEISAIEPEISSSGITRTVIRALNKMNRLHFGRHTRTFLNVKDSDIVRTIAREVGLRAQVDATSHNHEYVVQWNQTNMEFLAERARRNGYYLWADKDSLYFRKVETSGSPVVTLTFGDSLISFRPRLTLTQQVAGTAVHGWDPQAKQEFVGDGMASAQSSPATSLKSGTAWATTLASGSKLTVVDSLVLARDEATTYASALAEELSRNVMEAEAECYGSPLLVPGEMIQIANVGTLFNGRYYVTGVKHRYSADGYGCQLSLSGSQMATISGLIGGHSDTSPKVYGVMPALVTNLNDPLTKGRVKVKFVSMPPHQGTPLESHWVRIAAPMTGNRTGMFFMPEVNDEVLVAFEGGEPSRGYIVGSLWNGKDDVPISGYYENGVHKRGIKTRSGHTLTFDDKSGRESITLTDKAGNTLLLDAANKKVSLTSVGDMDITVQGNLKISTTGNFKADTTGNFNLENKGSFGIKSTGAATIESVASLTVKASGALSIQGTTVEVKANASLTLSSTGIAELKGSLVKIN